MFCIFNISGTVPTNRAPAPLYKNLYSDPKQNDLQVMFDRFAAWVWIRSDFAVLNAIQCCAFATLLIFDIFAKMCAESYHFCAEWDV